ncbi:MULTISPECIES: CBS domain-containing protein [unclassified Streptomyces]|uniref:CBS domain-containing protein n=1 Tax=unclassified Streptomyces TaxID=2593676 RepID=UPI0022B616BE|nr:MULTISPECIES: CBS domain-containing protein [unclassified Streptomyces]MCZ7417738.1 CBS domain-containing protein [Streptomyces sp. WMMC897]MCZ7432466.1 CBS domain-containing protein [Streptomyces sp. WMMC1477]
MHHRTVRDLMTRNVVRAPRELPFKEIVELLSDSGVTAVPVVDAAGRPMGVVSEADLLRKASDQPDASGLTVVPHLEAWQRAKAEGARAEELMSAPAVCARPDWTVVEAARLMEVQGVKRLPVVDATDRLVGIVSRSDLLRVFLRQDQAIHDEIELDVMQHTLGLAPHQLAVDVRAGRVTLRGTVESRSTVPLVVRLCRAVDGVVAVDEHLAFDRDDTASDAESTHAG